MTYIERDKRDHKLDPFGIQCDASRVNQTGFQANPFFIRPKYGCIKWAPFTFVKRGGGEEKRLIEISPPFHGREKTASYTTRLKRVDKKKQAMIRNLTELQSSRGDALMEWRLVEIILREREREREKVMSHKSR